MKFFTDYPIEGLGDVANKKAPIRECTILSYDGNKYCRVIVDGVETEFKAGYIYFVSGRCGEVPNIDEKILNQFIEA